MAFRCGKRHPSLFWGKGVFMIKNIILDVGMVLVDFCWQDVMKELGLSGNTLEIVADATVRSQAWNEYDRSVKPDEEILSFFLAAAMDKQEQVRLFWEQVGRTIIQYPYAKAWIASMKKAGYRVYILSNYARRTYELTKDTGLDFLPLVDGAVFSFQTGYIKPEKEIYHVMLDQFGLEPEECVFIDDSVRNLAYPKEIGFGTINFRSFSQVQEELAALGVSLADIKDLEYQGRTAE